MTSKMVTVKKIITNVGEVVEQLELSHLLVGIGWCNHWRTAWLFSIKMNYFNLIS